MERSDIEAVAVLAMVLWSLCGMFYLHSDDRELTTRREIIMMIFKAGPLMWFAFIVIVVYTRILEIYENVRKNK